jgi:hypothetical protein
MYLPVNTIVFTFSLDSPILQSTLRCSSPVPGNPNCSGLLRAIRRRPGAGRKTFGNDCRKYKQIASTGDLDEVEADQTGHTPGR